MAKKVPTKKLVWRIGLGDVSRLWMAPNWYWLSMSDPVNRFGSTWYYSEPSDVPYSSKPVSWLTFVAAWYCKSALLGKYKSINITYIHQKLCNHLLFQYGRSLLLYIRRWRNTQKHNWMAPKRKKKYLDDYFLCVLIYWFSKQFFFHSVKKRK